MLDPYERTTSFHLSNSTRHRLSVPPRSVIGYQILANSLREEPVIATRLSGRSKFRARKAAWVIPRLNEVVDINKVLNECLQLPSTGTILLCVLTLNEDPLFTIQCIKKYVEKNGCQQRFSCSSYLYKGLIKSLAGTLYLTYFNKDLRWLVLAYGSFHTLFLSSMHPSCPVRSK